MIKVKFNGETFDLPAHFDASTAREVLKESFPEISNADASTDEDGNITFRTVSGEKG